MNKMLPIIVAAGLVLSTLHANELPKADDPIYYTLSVVGGLAKPDDDNGLDDGTNFGLRLDIPREDFNTHLIDSLQFALDYHDLNTESAANNFSRQSFKASVNGLMYMFDDSVLNPFFLVGIGADRSKIDNASAETESFFNAGVGANVNVTPNFGLLLEAKNIYIDGQTETLANAGFRFGFGGSREKGPTLQDSDNDGVTDSKDRCPSTPEGAAVDTEGCLLDSDGDGIANIHDECPATPQGINVDNKGCVLDSDHDGVADAADKCPNTILGMEVDIQGCPRYFDFKIHFDLDKTTIKKEFISEIEKFADYLKRVPEYKVELIGYADESGESGYNQTLSEKRAIAVKKLLIEKGVEEDRITTMGAGERFPLEDNKDGISKENRRVRALLFTRLLAKLQKSGT